MNFEYIRELVSEELLKAARDGYNIIDDRERSIVAWKISSKIDEKLNNK